MVATSEAPSYLENPELPLRLQWTIQMVDDFLLALEGKVPQNGVVGREGREIWEERYFERFIDTIRLTRKKIVKDPRVIQQGNKFTLSKDGFSASVGYSGEDNETLTLRVARGENRMSIRCDDPGSTTSGLPIEYLKERFNADSRTTAEGMTRVIIIRYGRLFIAKKMPVLVNPQTIPPQA